MFTAVRIHHVVTGYEIDAAAIEEAIRLSEEKYCSVGAMVKQTASVHTTYEIVEEKTAWMMRDAASLQRQAEIPRVTLHTALGELWRRLSAISSGKMRKL